MSILGWPILGPISGFLASKIVGKHGEGVVLDTVFGIVGAVVVLVAYHAVPRV